MLTGGLWPVPGLSRCVSKSVCCFRFHFAFKDKHFRALVIAKVVACFYVRIYRDAQFFCCNLNIPLVREVRHGYRPGEIVLQATWMFAVIVRHFPGTSAQIHIRSVVFLHVLLIIRSGGPLPPTTDKFKPPIKIHETLCKNLQNYPGHCTFKKIGTASHARLFKNRLQRWQYEKLGILKHQTYNLLRYLLIARIFIFTTFCPIFYIACWR